MNKRPSVDKGRSISAEHAVELFFKGAAVQANGKFTGTHDLDQLYQQFRNLCPGKKFTFKADIVSFVKRHPFRPASEYPRYPVQKGGQRWPESENIIVEVWLDECTSLLEDFRRLIPLLKERYP